LYFFFATKKETTLDTTEEPTEHSAVNIIGSIYNILILCTNIK
jgi:hypothetical protein